MIARGRGTIVDIASMAAIAPTPGMFFYNASKAALAAASESLRGELRGTGVHVLTVYPGPVRTPMETAGRAAYEETAATRLFTPVGDARRARAQDRQRRRRPGARASSIRRVYAFARHFPNLTRFVLDRFTPPLKPLPGAAVEGKR